MQGQVGGRRHAATGSDATAAHRSADRTDEFVFTRIRYGGYRSTWTHDCPRADLHLPRIIDDITTIDARLGETNVFRLDDPELFRHPTVYISEPGFWHMSESEVESRSRAFGTTGSRADS